MITEQQAIEEWLTRHDGGHIEDFDGKNCSEYDDTQCGGWTYGDRRCECGNRRVTLMTHQLSNGDYYAYAAAW